MSFKIADAFVEVHARTDRVGSDVRSAVRGLPGKVGGDAERAGSGIGARIAKGLLNGLKGIGPNIVMSLGKAASAIAVVGSLALTAVPALISAGRWIGELFSAAGAATPALFALATAGGFVALTMKQIGPAVGEALTPIGEGFTKAGEAAARLAAQGIRPLAADFTRLNMPAISSGMNRIALATNGVVTRFLQWANSSPGIQAIRNTVDATSSAMERLGPHVSRLLESFGNMIGRIAGVSLAAGANGLGGVLDSLSRWFDRVNAATVRHGLDELIVKYHQVRDAISATVEWVRQAVSFWERYRTEIGLVQDALFVFAIAFGGIPGIIIGVVGLIIRHWDDLKAAWKSLSDYFTQNPAGAQAAGALQRAWETVKPSLLAFWEELKNKVGPVVSEIWNKIKNELIPAVADLAEAIAPFAKAFLDAFGPTVVGIIRGLGQVVLGLVDVITGGIKVIAGLLSNDWGKMWEGAKQLASGAGQMIAGAWNATAGEVIGTTGRLASGVNANLDTVKPEITTRFLGNTIDIVNRTAQAIGQINSVPGSHNTNLTATDNASRVAQLVKAAYAQIPRSVQTVITAVQRTVQGNANGAIMGMAAGGTLTPMSGRNATIVKPNTWRVIGDRLRGDEAFIPLNSSARSVAILTEAAKRMGFGLFKQAGGARPGSALPAADGTGGSSASLSAALEAALSRFSARMGGVTVNVTQTSGSPAETGRFVALALRTVG